MKNILILIVICGVMLNIVFAEETLSIEQLASIGKSQCQTFYNESYQKYTYIPSYDFDDKINNYIFIFYNATTENPKPDSIQRKELYNEIQELHSNRDSISKQTNLSGKKKGERKSIIVGEIQELENTLNGNSNYITVVISPKGQIVLIGDSLPDYFNYGLIEKAKLELNTQEVEIDKVYGGIFGGVIKYISKENNSIYLGYGHGFMNQIYNEHEFNNLKTELNNTNIFIKIMNWIKNFFIS